MSGTLSESAQIKLAHAANFIQRVNEEADRANAERVRLKQADDPTLCSILCDRSGPSASRLGALTLLLGKDHLRRDGTLARIMLPLMDDPDEEIAGFAIQYAPAEDPDVAARLIALLDDPRPARWSKAASVLARRKETTIIDRLLGWFRDGDRDHRNVAYSCLYFEGNLEPERCRELLREAWDVGGRDDDDRAMLAIGLLKMGDRIGGEFLEALARRADCYSATWAAEMIMEHDPGVGLDLMLHILDHGTVFEVRWGMVSRIATAAGLPHVWTADGLAEARYWVEQQRQKLESGCAVESLSSLPFHPH
jgi:hypothetical protein